MKKIILPLFLVAALPSILFANDEEIIVTAQKKQPPLMKLTTNYIVRNLNGDEVCNLAKGSVVAVSGAATDGQRVQIQVTSGPCAGLTNGFVYVNYLRPVTQNIDKHSESALVETAGLSLRKEPTVEDGTYSCALPKNTKLYIVGEKQKRNLWVQVEMDESPKGCPKTGWVVASYLKPDLDISSLPKINNQSSTEARHVKDCTDCIQSETSGGKKLVTKQTAAAAADINAFVQRSPEQAAGIPSPFASFAKDLQRSKKCPNPRQSDYQCNRGLVQMPADGNAGFCGSHHYTPDRPPGVDAYAAPLTACSLVGLAQEWKKTACPNDNDGCRIAWGDISHGTKALFNGHREHTNGECVDIRPFNKGSFRDAGRTVSSNDYDREKTTEFLKMAKKMGADVRFSDRKLMNENKDLDIAWGGSSHANHIHVCFKASDKKVQQACNNLTVDPKVCSEIQ